MIMKKVIFLATALAFAASTSAFAANTPAPAAPAQTKKVCHVVKGKEVCKDVKVHTKKAKKPAAKKPAAKKAK
jgi:Skp family chaperone for outer membrane proteins